MRVVLQRVSRASVAVEGEVVAVIGRGLCLLVGIGLEDDAAVVETAAGKLAELRVFPDSAGKMNLSVSDVGGEVLVVSQFTLLADTRKGRRPSFTAAAPPDVAEQLIGLMTERLAGLGLTVRSGVFGARMLVDLANEGPVTLVLEFEPANGN